MNNQDNKLIKAGSWLLHHFGFGGTSMDMLLKSSGVSVSNFYYYFECKEQFVSRVVGHLASQFEKNFLSTTVLNLDLEPLERFNSFYAKLTSSHASLFLDPPYPGCFFGNLALEKSSTNENLRSILQDFSPNGGSLSDSA